jgi:hypothetical protein
LVNSGETQRGQMAFLALAQVGHFEESIAIGTNQLLSEMGGMHEVVETLSPTNRRAQSSERSALRTFVVHRRAARLG